MDKEMLLRQLLADFKNVTLGSSPTLKESYFHDELNDPVSYEIDDDERLDWCRVPIKYLNLFFHGILFLGQAGLKFYLPAFIQSDLLGDLDGDLDLKRNLITIMNRGSGMVSLNGFSPNQKTTVNNYLDYKKHINDSIVFQINKKMKRIDKKNKP